MTPANIIPPLCLALLAAAAHAEPPKDDAHYWLKPMKKVHARFTGEKGTLANFGDSITVTMAYWAPLAYAPKDLPPEMAQALTLVKGRMKADCWDKWKGPAHGSEGGMTIRWAHENIDAWLKKLNPETAVILFGTNDLGQLDVEEYRTKTREVVDRCLANGTMVILTTPPPRSGQLEKARQFAAAVREVARAAGVPVVDYSAEILKRRPADWDGSLAKFKSSPGDEYQVPTLIARDGVHPSYPKAYPGYSEEALNHSGYALRNYLTLMTYADVIRGVLDAKK